MRLEQVLRDSRRSEMGATRLDGFAVAALSSVQPRARSCCSPPRYHTLGLSARDTLKRQRFQTKNVLAVDVGFERRVTMRQVVGQAQRTLDEVSKRPGVLAAAVAPLPGPVGSGQLIRVTPAGRDVIDLPEASVRSITGGYFSTLSIPLVAGRTFGPERAVDSVGLVIVGAVLAERLGPGSRPWVRSRGSRIPVTASARWRPWWASPPTSR